VEGYEAEVLGGLSAATHALSFEFTPEFLDVALECLRRASGLGFTTANYSLAEDYAIGTRQWVPLPQMSMQLEQWRGNTSIIGDVYVRAN